MLNIANLVQMVLLLTPFEQGYQYLAFLLTLFLEFIAKPN